jgi:HEAT repeat protein
MVVVLLLLSVFLVLIVLKERARKAYYESREKRLKRRIEPIIQEIVFGNLVNGRLNNAIKKLDRNISSGNKYVNHEVLNDLIIYYHKNIGGESAHKLESIYRQVNLKDQRLDLIKNNDWAIRSKAITDLGTMHMRESLFEILQFTDDSNEYVRNEAQYAAVKLGGIKSLEFLDSIKEQISEWQQIRLLDECLKFEYHLMKKVDDWMRSSNDSVVMFALKIIVNINQYQSSDQLVKLFVHPNKRIQKKALLTSVKLGIKEHLAEMLARYQKADTEIRVVIINAIGELGDASYISFLSDIIQQSSMYEEVLTASNAIKRFGRKDVLVNLKDVLKTNNLKIVEHALDERI